MSGLWLQLLWDSLGFSIMVQDGSHSCKRHFLSQMHSIQEGASNESLFTNEENIFRALTGFLFHLIGYGGTPSACPNQSLAKRKEFT